MKKLLILLILPLLLIPPAAHSQAFTDVDVQTGPNSWNTSPGILSLPASYPGSSTRYPLIIFFHGAGEASSSRNDALLMQTGLPQLINGGQVPKAINPVDGREYEFIVLAPQHSYFSFGVDNSQMSFYYMLNWAIANYRIDTTRIYLTGLSSGAQSTIEAVVWDDVFAKRIAAIYPISLTNLGMGGQRPIDSIPQVGKRYKVKSWTVVGSNDTYINGVNPYQISQTYNDLYNSTNPSPLGIRTIIAGANHSPATWNTAYDKNWGSNSNNTVAKNMYEWFLQYQQGGTPPPPASNVQLFMLIKN